MEECLEGAEDATGVDAGAADECREDAEVDDGAVEEWTNEGHLDKRILLE